MLYPINIGYFSLGDIGLFLIERGVLFMKILNVYMVANPETDLAILENVSKTMPGMAVRYETDAEAAINTIGQQGFDLLVLDKQLTDETFNKLHKLADLLHPDAAQVDFVLTDEDFIRYKLNGLMAKWIEAQSDSKVNYIDDPAL